MIDGGEEYCKAVQITSVLFGQLIAVIIGIY